MTDVTLTQVAYMHCFEMMLSEPVDALQTVSGHWQALCSQLADTLCACSLS